MDYKNADFAENNGLIVGLDVGTTKIVTVIGYLNDMGEVDVVGFGQSESRGVEYGEIQNIVKTTEGIELSKQVAEQRSNQQVNQVYVGVAGHHVKTNSYRHVLYRHEEDKQKMPITQEEIDNLKDDVAKVSQDPGIEIIDVIPQSYTINKMRETFDPVGELGYEVIGKYQLITGNQREIEKIIQCAQGAGVIPKEIVLEPIASGIACLSDEEKKQGCVLVDIGGGTTDMVIFIDGHPVFTKVIPIGGNIITKDIAQVCKIPEATAEKIKIDHGTCIIEKNSGKTITIPKAFGSPVQISEYSVAQIINCRVQREIIDVVKAEIERSGYASRLNAGIVLTGGGSNLRHLRELFEFNVQLPTRIGIPDNKFARNIPSELRQPMYATALGLLKYGIDVEWKEGLTGHEEQETSHKESKFKRKKKTETNASGNGSNESSAFNSFRRWVKNFLEKVS